MDWVHSFLPELIELPMVLSLLVCPWQLGRQRIENLPHFSHIGRTIVRFAGQTLVNQIVKHRGNIRSFILQRRRSRTVDDLIKHVDGRITVKRIAASEQKKATVAAE